MKKLSTEEIRYAYKSKYNKQRKNQAILLVITDGKMQKLSPLFIGITSKNKEDFYC